MAIKGLTVNMLTAIIPTAIITANIPFLLLDLVSFGLSESLLEDFDFSSRKFLSLSLKVCVLSFTDKLLSDAVGLYCGAGLGGVLADLRILALSPVKLPSSFIK